MGREIKFRAWHINLEQMFQVTSVSWANGETFELGLAKDGKAFGERDVLACHLIQFTGQKDENGAIEIYEGDVVQVIRTNDARTEGHTGRVVWLWYRWAVLDPEGNSMDLDGCSYQFKHLGNIYENPDLLPNK